MPDVENIRVMARINPRPDDDPCVDRVDDGTIVPLELGGTRHHHKFHFDHVFAPNSEQDDVFQRIGVPALDKVMEGYNGTVFAYGQTGSGKTHTMLAPSGGHPSCLEERSPQFAQRGLIPRISAELFRRLGAEIPSRVKCSVKASFYEIYNEELIDLLVPSGQKPAKIRLEGTRDTFRINGLLAKEVGSPADLLTIVSQGTAQRHVAATKMNDTSSRSHSILQVNVVQYDEVMQNVTSSQLNLVDLAGCESLGRTGATGQTAAEGMKINLSLTTLGIVINQLCRAEKFISFRDSLLTRVLQNSLGGNALTTMIVTMSQLRVNYSDTVACLRFAERAKQIKCKARINKQRTAAEWELLFRQAEDEIAALKQRLATPGSLRKEKGGDTEASAANSAEVQELLAKLDLALEEQQEQRALLAEKDKTLFAVEQRERVKQEELDEMKVKMASIELESTEYEALYKASKRSTEKLEGNLKDEQAAKAELQGRMKGLRSEIAGLREQEKEKDQVVLEREMLDIEQRAEIQALKEELERTKANLGEKAEELHELEEQLEEEKSMSKQAEGTLAAQLESLRKLQNDGSIQDAIAEAVSQSNDTIAVLKGENVRLRDEAKVMKQKLIGHTTASAQLTAQVEQEQKKVMALEQIQERTKSNHEEMVRTVRRHAEEIAGLQEENLTLQEKLTSETVLMQSRLKAKEEEVKALLLVKDEHVASLATIKQKDALIAQLQDRLRELEHDHQALEAEAERNREEINTLGKDCDRYKKELRQRDTTLAMYHAQVKASADLIVRNRELAKKDKEEIMSLLNQVLNADERDTLDKLASKIFDEETQHSLIMHVTVLLDDRSKDVGGMVERVESLTAAGEIIPEYIEKNARYIQRELSKVVSILNLQAFYDPDDEASRREFLEKSASLKAAADKLLTELEEYQEMAAKGQTVVCPFCAQKFPKDEIKAHVDTAH